MGHAQGHTQQNKHTIHLSLAGNMPLQRSPNSHPAARTMALNGKQQLLSALPTDEEPGEPAGHVSVAVTGLN